VLLNDRQKQEEEMLKPKVATLLGAAAILALPALLTTLATAQAPATPPPMPQIAPTLVPSHVVDLTTAEGMAAFSAQWKHMEAKIVEGPALPNAMPGYKTSYDIAPHAGEAGFDDSSWPTIEPKGLLDRRGSSGVSMVESSVIAPLRKRDFSRSPISPKFDPGSRISGRICSSK
jgi:hypothetical protein